MAGGVDQVDEEAGGGLLLLLDEGHVLLSHVEVHGDGAANIKFVNMKLLRRLQGPLFDGFSSSLLST